MFANSSRPNTINNSVTERQRTPKTTLIQWHIIIRCNAINIEDNSVLYALVLDFEHAASVQTAALNCLLLTREEGERLD